MNEAMTYSPPLRMRIYQRLGFRYSAPFIARPDDDDAIYTTHHTSVHWDWWDRLRILVSGRTEHCLLVHTESLEQIKGVQSSAGVLAPDLAREVVRDITARQDCAKDDWCQVERNIGARLEKPMTVLEEIAAERQRQIDDEGWTSEHDDGHADGELARAAACYAISACGGDCTFINQLWPWNWDWWKPKNKRRDLIRAGALLVAEAERLDRGQKRGG